MNALARLVPLDPTDVAARDRMSEIGRRLHAHERVASVLSEAAEAAKEPRLKSEGIFKSKGSIQVWLTDDERRLPVMVRSKVPVGAISVRLTDYRLAFEKRP